MSADGELYINETCRDTFAEELDEWFGKNKWNINAGDFTDFWNMSQFPLKIEVDILDEKWGNIIGRVEITSEQSIQNDGYGAYIEVEPCEIKRIK